MRIFIHNSLKLLLGSVGAFFGGGEAGYIRLSWRTGRAQRRVHGANGLRELKTGLFVLRSQIKPTAQNGAYNDGDHDSGNDQGGSVFDRPMSGLFGSLESDTAESVLFKVMAGLCAHGLPF